MTWTITAGIAAGVALVAALLMIVARMPPSKGSVRVGSHGGDDPGVSPDSVSDFGGGHCHGGDVGGGDCGGDGGGH